MTKMTKKTTKIKKWHGSNVVISMVCRFVAFPMYGREKNRIDKN